MNDEFSAFEFIGQHIFDKIEITSPPFPDQPDFFISAFDFLEWSTSIVSGNQSGCSSSERSFFDSPLSVSNLFDTNEADNTSGSTHYSVNISETESGPVKLSSLEPSNFSEIESIELLTVPELLKSRSLTMNKQEDRRYGGIQRRSWGKYAAEIRGS